MSWFTSYVQHPALAALAGLVAHPAIAGNPEAVAAVSEAKAAGTAIASATNAAASQVAATAEAQVDPIVGALGKGAESLVDAYLIATLGSVGVVAVPLANGIIVMGEQWLHTHIAALFAHAKTAHALAAAEAAPVNTIPSV